MAFIGKTYQHEKDENFDGFIDSLGISPERSEIFKKLKPTHQLKKDGDTYTLVTNNTEVNFQSGVEFNTTAPGGSEPIKTVITVDGDSLTQVEKFEDGRTVTFKREYSGDKLVVTITSSFWDGTATRYYSAV